jgi:hypothetical protein
VSTGGNRKIYTKNCDQALSFVGLGSIAVDELEKVSHNLFMRCEACLQAESTFSTCYKAR